MDRVSDDVIAYGEEGWASLIGRDNEALTYKR